MAPSQSTDIDLVLAFFDRTYRRIVAITTGLSDAQWRFKPAPDCWSIAEIVEHMVTVEERVLGPVRQQLEHAPPPPADHDFASVDRIIKDKMPDRSVKGKAPEVVRPTGDIAPSDAVDRLSRNYRRLAEYVRSTPGLRKHLLESPPLRYLTDGAHTRMDGLQWALTAALHDERHARQIEDWQANPAYPRA